MQCGGITPFRALLPRAANLADAAGVKFPGAGRGGSPPSGTRSLRNSGLAKFQRLHPRPHNPGTHPGAAQKSGCASERAAWGAVVMSPKSTGKCLRCKDMPFSNHLNSPAKGQILPSYRNCGSRLTAPNLRATAPNLTRAPSHHSHSSSPRLTRAGRLGLARHARLPSALQALPAGTAQNALALGAGTRRPPGAIFLESQRAPGRALLTCVFFIRKGSAVIQPRQRCGNSV